MVQSIKPFLMFEGSAEQAMNFYVGLFGAGTVTRLLRYGPEGPGAEGSVQQATFTIAGQDFMCIDSPAKHGFTFTPSLSLYVECDSVAEIDRLFAGLSDGGKVMMPLQAYPFSPRFGWVQDPFGVSWQLTLPQDG